MGVLQVSYLKQYRSSAGIVAWVVFTRQTTVYSCNSVLIHSFEIQFSRDYFMPLWRLFSESLPTRPSFSQYVRFSFLRLWTYHRPSSR